MGKKNRKAKSVTAEADSGMPRHVRREVLEIVNQLLESEHISDCVAVSDIALDKCKCDKLIYSTSLSATAKMRI